MSIECYATEFANDADPDRAPWAIRLAWICASEPLSHAWPLIEQALGDWEALGLALDCARGCQNWACVDALDALFEQRAFDAIALSAPPCGALRRL